MTDKTPPHSREAELAVIGSVLVYGERSMMHALGLRPDEFFFPAHRDAWAAINAAQKRAGAATDPVSVEVEIKSAGVGGGFDRGWISWASTVAATAACVPEMVEQFATIVREHAAARKMIQLCTELQLRAYSGTAWPDLLEEARAGMGELEACGAASNTAHVYEPMIELLDELDKRQQGIRPELVTTAISTLDDVVDGFEGGQLIVVAARPGQGKTALACNIAAANGLRGIPCLIFSLEMRMRKLARRMLIWHSKIDGGKLNNADVATWGKISAAVSDFEKATIWLNDRARRIGQIASESCLWHAKRVRGKAKRAVVMVDYAQLAQAAKQKGRNREQEVAEISGTLKGLAMHLDVPVVMLSQLSRTCEQRGGAPILSDLRESGAIEQDADMVLFPYRDIPAGDQSKRNERGPGQIIVAKNRDGRIGAASIEWIPELMTFKSATDADLANPNDWQGGRDE